MSSDAEDHAQDPTLSDSGGASHGEAGDATHAGESAETIDHAAASTPSKPRRRRWRWVVGGVLLAALATGGVFVVLLRTDPAAVREQRAAFENITEAEVVAITASVENRLLGMGNIEIIDPGPHASAWSIGADGSAVDAANQSRGAGVRPLTPHDDGAARPANYVAGEGLPSVGAVYRVQLSPTEVNVWITERLNEWMSYRDVSMPDQIEAPLFALDDDALLVAFAVSFADVTQNFNIRFGVGFNDDGYASIKVEEVLAGMVPVPAGEIGSFLSEQAPNNPQAQRVGSWLDKIEDYEFKPVMKLTEQKRKLRVQSYNITSNGLFLTVQVEAARGQRTTTVASVQPE